MRTSNLVEELPVEVFLKKFGKVDMHGEWGRSHSGYLKELVEAGPWERGDASREDGRDCTSVASWGCADIKHIAAQIKPSLEEIKLKVLFTGATAGFGAAIVRHFAADGH